MFVVKIDRTDRVLLHDQVAGCIRNAIATGELNKGDQLPLAADIARSCAVTKNTALRALHILRDENLLAFQRGRRITVVGTPERTEVLVRVRELVDLCQIRGYRPDEVIQMMERLW